MVGGLSERFWHVVRDFVALKSLRRDLAKEHERGLPTGETADKSPRRAALNEELTLLGEAILEEMPIHVWLRPTLHIDGTRSMKVLLEDQTKGYLEPCIPYVRVDCQVSPEDQREHDRARGIDGSREGPMTLGGEADTVTVKAPPAGAGKVSHPLIDAFGSDDQRALFCELVENRTAFNIRYSDVSGKLIICLAPDGEGGELKDPLLDAFGSDLRQVVRELTADKMPFIVRYDSKGKAIVSLVPGAPDGEEDASELYRHLDKSLIAQITKRIRRLVHKESPFSVRFDGDETTIVLNPRTVLPLKPAPDEVIEQRKREADRHLRIFMMGDRYRPPEASQKLFKSLDIGEKAIDFDGHLVMATLVDVPDGAGSIVRVYRSDHPLADKEGSAFMNCDMTGKGWTMVRETRSDRAGHQVTFCHTDYPEET